MKGGNGITKLSTPPQKKCDRKSSRDSSENFALTSIGVQFVLDPIFAPSKNRSSIHSRSNDRAPLNIQSQFTNDSFRYVFYTLDLRIFCYIESVRIIGYAIFAESAMLQILILENKNRIFI